MVIILFIVNHFTIYGVEPNIFFSVSSLQIKHNQPRRGWPQHQGLCPLHFSNSGVWVLLHPIRLPDK